MYAFLVTVLEFDGTGNYTEQYVVILDRRDFGEVTKLLENKIGGYIKSIEVIPAKVILSGVTK
jgi:hypothetical protein